MLGPDASKECVDVVRPFTRYGGRDEVVEEPAEYTAVSGAESSKSPSEVLVGDRRRGD